MSNQEIIKELRQLQRESWSIKTKLIELVHNKHPFADESIAVVRLENFDNDVEMIIKDLEQEHE